MIITHDFDLISIYVVFSALFIIVVTDSRNSLVKNIAVGAVVIAIFLGLYFIALNKMPPEQDQLYLRCMGVYAGMCFSAFISKHDGAVAIFPFLVSLFLITIIEAAIEATDILLEGNHLVDDLVGMTLAAMCIIGGFILKDVFDRTVQYTVGGWWPMNFTLGGYCYLIYLLSALIDKGVFLAIRISLGLLMLTVFVSIVVLASRAVREQSERYYENMLAQQLKASEDQAEMFYSNERKFSILRHDMRHNIGMAIDLLKEENTEAALDLLERTGEDISASSPVKYCQNIYINAAVSMYMRKAEAEDIKTDVMLDIPENIGLNAHRLAVVVSNLLENAINACKLIDDKSKRYIVANARDTGSNLIIKISNSSNKKPRLNSMGIPTSDIEGHGIGTVSVLSFVDENEGAIDYDFDDENFTVKVFLNYA